MQQSFQATVAQAIVQSLQNNNTMESIPINQPYYNSQTSNTTNNQSLEHNTNETNNTSIISPNDRKKKSSNGKTNNSTNNINFNCSTTTTKNTNSNFSNAQKIGSIHKNATHKRHVTYSDQSEPLRILKQVTDHKQIESILPFLHHKRDPEKSLTHKTETDNKLSNQNKTITSHKNHKDSNKRKRIQVIQQI